MIEYALMYAKKGWYVFPCKDNKAPMIPAEKGGKGFKDATTNEEQIRKWWAEYPKALIGIATGAVSGIVVLDVDKHSEESNGETSLKKILAKHPNFPFPVKAYTPSGGYHYYYKHQFDIVSQIGYAPGIDIKSDGGYVIAPPSKISETKRYYWCENKGPENDLTDAPGWMAEITQKPIFTNGSTIAEGKRDVTLTSFAGVMREKGAGPETIYAALKEENKKCAPPLPDSQLRRIANSIGRYETRGRLVVPETKDHFWKSADWGNGSDEDIMRSTKEVIIKYHISYLDDYLTGILPGELVIVGADTGVGKTQFANDMAFYNMSLEKHCYLFSLEGDVYDAFKREWYKRAISLVRKDEEESGKLVDFELSYDSFIMNIEPRWVPYRQATKQDLINDIDKYLHVFKRKSVVSVDNICEALDTVDEKIDLVVIDHLHYFELMTPNEYVELTEILKKIREMIARLRVPVVLVSHLRQKHKDRILPNNEDFHGTSNIPKQADTCVIISKFTGDDTKKSFDLQMETQLYPTIVQVTKSRRGKSTSIAGVLNFDGIRKTYSENYKVYGVSGHGAFPATRIPKWAVRAEIEENKQEDKYDWLNK